MMLQVAILLAIAVSSSNLNGASAALEPSNLDMRNCSNLMEFKIVNLVVSTSGFFCLMIVALITLVLILYYRVYKHTLHRMLLYLNVMIMIKETCIGLYIELQFVEYQGQGDVLCQVLGFIHQCLTGMIFIYTAGLTFHLLCSVYTQLKGHPFPRLSKSKAFSRIVEFLYIAAALVLAVAYSWYPFVDGTGYGPRGATCWIRTLDDDCEYTRGSRDSKVFMAVLETLNITCVIVLLVTVCILRYASRKIRTQQMVVVLCQVQLMLAAWILSIILLPVGLILTLIDHFTALYIANVLQPYFLLMIPAGYLVYTCICAKTPRAGRAHCGTCVCCGCCLTSDTSESSPSRSKLVPVLQHSSHLQTNPSSHYQSLPSHTYYDVEYTGNFTSITANDVMAETGV